MIQKKMKIFRKREGLPFLFTISFILITSMGFLVYQLNGAPSSAGSAAALEAPPPPPPLATSDENIPPATSENPPPNIENSDSKTAGVIPPATSKETSHEQANASASKSLHISKLEPTSKKEKKENTIKTIVNNNSAVPQKTKPASKTAVNSHINPKIIDNAINNKISANASSGSKSQTKRKAKKYLSQTSKHMITQTSQEPEGTIPPEWNWFEKPLTISYNDGKVTLVTDQDNELVVVNKKQPSENNVNILVSKKSSNNKKDDRITESPENNQKETYAAPLFQIPLARMEAKKEKRVAQAVQLKVTLPSNGGNISNIAPSLMKMKKILNELALKLDCTYNNEVQLSEKQDSKIETTHVSSANSSMPQSDSKNVIRPYINRSWISPNSPSFGIHGKYLSNF